MPSSLPPAALRTRNKEYYRVLHVPIWIWVFFTLPGAMTAALYATGFHREQVVWLVIAAAVCIWRGAQGRLPGTEPRPYITHYGLEWPNLPYRVVCYTAAWIAILAPWLLNAIGLIVAVASGRWIVRSLYGWPYDVVALAIVAVMAAGKLPRAGRTIRNEGAERAWFYLGVWTAILSQLAAWAMWRLGSRFALAPVPLAWLRFAVFFGMSAVIAGLCIAGRLPRTRRVHVARGAEHLPEAASE